MPYQGGIVPPNYGNTGSTRSPSAGGVSFSYGTSFPASPGTGDIHKFNGAATGLTNAIDASSAALTTANKGDEFEYGRDTNKATSWQRVFEDTGATASGGVAVDVTVLPGNYDRVNNAIPGNDNYHWGSDTSIRISNRAGPTGSPTDNSAALGRIAVGNTIVLTRGTNKAWLRVTSVTAGTSDVTFGVTILQGQRSDFPSGQTMTVRFYAYSPLSSDQIGENAIEERNVADDAIAEPSLKMHNTPGDGQVIQWNNTDSRMEWQDPAPPPLRGDNFPTTNPTRDGTRFFFTAAQTTFTAGKTVEDLAGTAVTSAAVGDEFEWSTSDTKWIRIYQAPTSGTISDTDINIVMPSTESTTEGASRQAIAEIVRGVQSGSKQLFIEGIYGPRNPLVAGAFGPAQLVVGTNYIRQDVTNRTDEATVLNWEEGRGLPLVRMVTAGGTDAYYSSVFAETSKFVNPEKMVVNMVVEWLNNTTTGGFYLYLGSNIPATAGGSENQAQFGIVAFVETYHNNAFKLALKRPGSQANLNTGTGTAYNGASLEGGGRIVRVPIGGGGSANPRTLSFVSINGTIYLYVDGVLYFRFVYNIPTSANFGIGDNNDYPFRRYQSNATATWNSTTNYSVAAYLLHNGNSWTADTDPGIGDEPGVSAHWRMTGIGQPVQKPQYNFGLAGRPWDTTQGLDNLDTRIHQLVVSQVDEAMYNDNFLGGSPTYRSIIGDNIAERTIPASKLEDGVIPKWVDTLPSSSKSGDIVQLQADANSQESYLARYTRSYEPSTTVANFSSTEFGIYTVSGTTALQIALGTAEAPNFTGLASGDKIIFKRTSGDLSEVSFTLSGAPTTGSRNSVTTVRVVSSNYTQTGTFANADYAVYAIKVRNEVERSTFRSDGAFWQRISEFTAPPLGANAVQKVNMADNSVGSAEIENNAVITEKVNNGAITSAKLSQAYLSMNPTQIPGTWQKVTGTLASGDWKVLTGNRLQVHNTNAEGNSQVTPLAAPDISDYMWVKLGADNAPSRKTTLLQVGTGASQDATASVFPYKHIGGDTLESYAVNDSVSFEYMLEEDVDRELSQFLLRAGSVDTVHLADDAVENAQIADDAVDTPQIADGAVNTDALGRTPLVSKQLVGTGNQGYSKVTALTAAQQVRWQTATTLEIQARDADLNLFATWAKSPNRHIMLLGRNTGSTSDDRYYLLSVSAVSRADNVFTLTVALRTGSSAYTTWNTVQTAVPIKLFLDTETPLGYLDRRTSTGALAAGEYRANSDTLLEMRYVDKDGINNEVALKAVAVNDYIGVGAIDGSLAGLVKVTAKTEGTNDISFTMERVYRDRRVMMSGASLSFVRLTELPFVLDTIPGLLTGNASQSPGTLQPREAGLGLFENTGANTLNVGAGHGIETDATSVGVKLNGASLGKNADGVWVQGDTPIWTPSTRQTSKQVYNLDFGKSFADYEKIVFELDNGSANELGPEFVIPRAKWEQLGPTTGMETFWFNNGWISLRWKSNTSFEFLSTSSGVGGLRRALGRYH